MTIRSCATVYGDHTDPGWSATDWVLVFLADELHDTVDVSDQHREEGQVLLSMAYAWFTRHLPIPGRIARHFKRRNSIWGICWFDPRALEAVSRARYCAWLLEEGGLPVRAIATSREREVMWRDAHQIVTKPSADLPKAFP